MIDTVFPGCPEDAFWIDPVAPPGGTGTQTFPFASLPAALAVGGGESEYWFKPGLYYGGLRLTKEFSGTKKHPTKLVSAVKWGARIMGSPFHGIETADDTNWAQIDGFEVTGASADGIKLSGDDSKVMNCWAHGNGNNGLGCHSRARNTFAGNLVEFNGIHPQFHHGIYVDGADMSITRNIVRHNSGYGMQLYPGLTDSEVSLNLIHGHANHAGMIVCPPAGGGKSRILYNTLVGNAGGVEMLGGNGEEVINNILCGPAPYSESKTIQAITLGGNLSDTASLPGVRVGNPLFVAPSFNVYWLGAGSAAIGAASLEWGVFGDFWGRSGGQLDAGCFAYVPSLEKPEARSGWRSGWPYRFSAGMAGGEMPDLWIPPA